MSTNKSAPTVLVTVPPHTNVREIAELLKRRHLVRSVSGFVLAARLQGLSSHLKAGSYELSPAMPPRQMAALIALGQTATDLVTIPEGYTVTQIAHRLAEHQMADEAKFLKLAQTQGTTFAVGDFHPPRANLEGYLYPDTYRFPKGATERQIITEMLANFRKRVLALDNGALQKEPARLDAVVNLASLVEREAEVDKDRPLIAGALSNRLKIHMPLECDATVQYALPSHKTRLFYRDLRVDSPYNTYLHPGLPPTPIASPGLPSIEAALHPAVTNALFYVAKPDGSHIFSATLAEHDRAISQLRAQRGGT